MDTVWVENEVSTTDNLILHDAVCDLEENIEEIRNLIAENSNSVFETNKDLQTPLHALASSGKQNASDIAKLLLGVSERGQNSPLVTIERPKLLNLLDSQKYTALHYAAQCRKMELVKSLLEWGADSTLIDIRGNTPMHLVVNGNTDNAVKVLQLLMNQDKNNLETQPCIDRKNVDGQTPLHIAISKKSIKIVKLMLELGSEKNFGVTDFLGRTAFHLACSEIGDSNTACELVRCLFSHKVCTKILASQKDIFSRTALHLAAIRHHPQIISVLIKVQKIDVMVVDSQAKTAFHYAAEDGRFVKGSECVEELIKINFPKAQDKVNFLCKMEDDKKHTPFMYACVNCPTAIMTKYMTAAPCRMDWLPFSSNMAYLMSYAPLALKPLMDGSFTETQYYENPLRAIKALTAKVEVGDDTTYESRLLAIKGISEKALSDNTELPKALLGDIQTLVEDFSTTDEEECKRILFKIRKLIDKGLSLDGEFGADSEDLINIDFGLIVGYTDPLSTPYRQESHFLKEGLRWDYNNQKEVLLHPLVQTFVEKKWKHFQWIIVCWILWQLIWLAAYTFLAMSFFIPHAELSESYIVSPMIMVTYAATSLINEMFEVRSTGPNYFLTLRSIVQIVQIVLACTTVYPVLFGVTQPDNWTKVTTAMGITLAYVLSMRDIGQLNGHIGFIVQGLWKVVVKVIKVLLCCMPLVIGFTVAFTILLPDEKSMQSTFPGPLVKVLVMMTGEFEYNETFNKDESEKENLGVWYRAIRFMIFCVFLIALPVGFLNLLTAFALDKIMEHREHAKVARVAKKLEHIYFVETILMTPYSFLLKIGIDSTYTRFLRKCNVTTVWLNPDGYKFEFLIKEKLRKSERSRKRGLSLLRKFISIFYSELPSELQMEICALVTTKNDELK